MVRVAPELARLRADRSVYAHRRRFVEDEHLRQALSFHSLLVGGNPFETSSIYTLIHYLERSWGVFFPRGGTGALVQRAGAAVRGARRRAAAVVAGDADRRCASSTARVCTACTRAHGAARPFDLVVSNADLHHTYAELCAASRARSATRKRVEALDWSMSLFVLYFGTDRLYRDQLAHHTVLFGPRYEELLDDIFHGSRLPDDFSLYLHAPTVTDPALAPPGCDSFYVLSPVPHLGHAPLDWDAVAPRYAERILQALEQVLPDLRKHVVVQALAHAAAPSATSCARTTARRSAARRR